MRDVQREKRVRGPFLELVRCGINPPEADLPRDVVKTSVGQLERGTVGLSGRPLAVGARCLQVVLDEGADHVDHRFVGGEAQHAGAYRLE
jgi:hypothetical protein